MELVIIFYILFIIFFSALIISALTGSKILKNKKDAIGVYSIGTVIYGVLFFLTLRLELSSYNYIYMEPVSKTSINRKVSSKVDGNNKGNSQEANQEKQIKTQNNHKGKIKGNINKNTGEKIYHVPGSTYYDRTIAEEWFSTIEEAEKAGYRAPKR
ncbi:hypothetical protein [Clostridium tetani]|uniref:sunset domain-containing protein n=1 Tax=Clostridium tetani TaxID=1513 RepID=UPI0003C0C635|nr:hypothetical protein [Clostridium tetani]KHO39509.1 hypothetical protein OR62_05530 [Clostridium tetani]CDI49167.1 membrane spanning protein [Clostridium tetani 12124569]